MSRDLSNWSKRLAELAGEHGVPGASLAVLVDGDVFTTAAGVLNVETGVEATPDSVFQLGSITKVYTATVLMRLVDAGQVDLDAPLVAALPEFRVADPDVTRAVTPRHLLTHTSGIAGDCFEDTGRGDEALERYVAACAELGQDVPFGATMSYCNTGYCILGRLIERLTGRVWDDAMREKLFAPLGLERTVTLPEDALRFRTAWGHVSRAGRAPEPAPYWDDPRSLGPAGSVCASAADVIAFARLHLSAGRTAEGAQLLSPGAVAAMQTPHVEVPDRWSTGDDWGLGWSLQRWGDHRLVSHDGNTVGQNAFLHVLPDEGVAVALLTNIANALAFSRAVLGELLAQVCGARIPPWPEPACDDAPGASDIVGSYRRYGIQFEVERGDDRLEGTIRVVEPLASQLEDDELQLVTVRICASGEGGDIYVAQFEEGGIWLPLVLFEIDGARYLHTGARAQRRIAPTES